jgi:hypothetical protein
MMRYTPTRRMEVVALDIMELSPVGKNGEKVVVIGDVKSRFVLAVPCRGEHAETLSRICGSGGLQYSARLKICWWTLENIDCPIMRNLCARAGVAKIFTSGYHHQCNGMAGGFTVPWRDLAKTILCEESWPEHLPTCVFGTTTMCMARLQTCCTVPCLV